MSGRVGNVDTAGEHRNGEAVARQRRAVRGPVDAVCAARHHGHVARGQSRRQVRRDMLAVGRRRPRADDRRGPAGHVVQPGRADRPQHQTADAPAGCSRASTPANAAKASSGHSASSAVTSRPPRRASSSRSFAAQSIRVAPRLRRASCVTDRAPPDPLGGLDGPDAARPKPTARGTAARRRATGRPTRGGLSSVIAHPRLAGSSARR